MRVSESASGASCNCKHNAPALTLTPSTTNKITTTTRDNNSHQHGAVDQARVDQRARRQQHARDQKDEREDLEQRVGRRLRPGQPQVVGSLGGVQERVADVEQRGAHHRIAVHAEKVAQQLFVVVVLCAVVVWLFGFVRGFCEG